MNVAVYSCDTGYILWGRHSRTCRADGMWSYGAPTCLSELYRQTHADTHTDILVELHTKYFSSVVDCGLLGHPQYGRVNTDSGTTYNSMATYSCNEGYYLNGSASRTCMANGEWSQSTSSCIRKCVLLLCLVSDYNMKIQL